MNKSCLRTARASLTRLMSVLLVCALLPWYGLAYADGPLPALPYSEDFESGAAAGWTVDTGTWTVGEDAGTLAYRTRAADSIARSVYGEFTWDHYETAVDFKLNGWGSEVFQTTGILMRYTDANHYYLFTYDKPGEIRICKKVGGVVTVLAKKAMTLDMGQWHRLGASVDHARLKLYVNGAEELSFTDFTYTSGKTGLLSAFGDISYDNVEMAQLQSPPDTQAPTVPANVQAGESQPGIVSLTWEPSSDNDEVAGYQIFRDGSALALVTSVGYTDVSTQPGKAYSYTVAALDVQGNASSPSLPAWVTTSAIENNTSFDSELLGVHPRILVSSGMQTELQRRAADPDYAGFYDSLVTLSTNAPDTVNWFASSAGTDFNWEYVSWRLPTIAMAYLATGDSLYGNKVRNYVLDLIARPEWGGEEGGGMANANGLMGVGYAYDWGYDLFTPAERAQIAVKLKQQAKKLYTQFSANLTGALGYWKTDYQNNHMQLRVEGLLTAIAAIIGDLNDPEIAAMYQFAEQELKTVVQQRAPDGSQHESAQYMIYGDEHVIRSVAAYESFTGISLWNDTLRNIGQFKQYLYGPGLTKLAPYADDSNSSLYYFNHVLFKVASVYRDAQLQSMLERAYQVSPGSFTWPAWSFLFYDDTLEADPTPLPGWRYFDDLEYVNFRTGWEASDLSIAFKSGPPGGHTLNAWRDRIAPDGTYVNVAHDRPEAGNFYIEFANKRWGEFPPYDKKDRQTKDHNTILVDGKGQHGERTDAWFQPFNGMRDEARISEFFGSPGYGIATGDIRNAYDNMSRMDRDLLFMDGRYVIVHDQLEASGGARDFQFLFHNKGEWTGSLEDGYVITQDGASMELYMLEPEAMTGTLTPARKPDMGMTLKVSPATVQEKTSFLGVFFPRRNGEALPVKPVATRDQEGTKLTVARGGEVTDTIAFSGSPTGTGPLTASQAVAAAKTLAYTADASLVRDAMMAEGTTLSLADIRFDFDRAVNMRYAREAGGFTLWAAPTLESGAQSAQAVVRGLVPLTAYQLEWSTGAEETLVSDGGGTLTLPLNFAGENLSVRITGPLDSDTTPPAAPSGLTAIPVSDRKIRLEWTASVDNISVRGYEILRDSVSLGQVGGTAFTDTGLSASTAYSYKVKAFDLAGNVSEGAIVAAVTLEPDVTPPSAPADLSGYQSASGIVLNWTPSTDDRELAGYRVYRDGELLAEADSPAYTDRSTEPNTAYTYTVQAVDDSGNLSAASSPFAIATSSVLYSTDFEGPVSEWTVLQGTWSIETESGNRVYKSSTSYGNVAVVGDIGWTDYTVQAEFKVNSFTNATTPHIGFRVRQTAGNNYYFMGFKNNKLMILGMVNGVSGGGAQKAYQFPTGDWHTMKAVVSGSTLKLYVDGQLELTATDSRLASGYAGLDSRYADARVDDFLVYQDDVTPPTVPANLSGHQSFAGVELVWTPSTDAGQVGYKVYRDGAQIATVSSPAYVDPAPESSAVHSYTVSAFDLHGNESAPSAAFSVAAWNILYRTDFEAPVPEWTVSTGSWSLSPEDTQVYKPGTGHDNTALIGSGGVSDYRVQVKVKADAFTNDNAPQVGIRVRQTDGNNFYFLGYRDGNLNIARRVNGHNGSNSYKPFAMTPGEWYIFEAVVKGSTLSLYVNGNLELTWTDSNLASGFAGLYSRFADARFDDFVLYQETEADS